MILLKQLGFEKTALSPKQIKQVAQYRRKLANKKRMEELLHADVDLRGMQGRTIRPKSIITQRNKLYRDMGSLYK